MNKDERFIFRADSEVRTKLETLAEEKGMSMSEVIRTLIEKEWLIAKIPLIGTISEKGINIKDQGFSPLSFEKTYGRKPVAGIDYSDDAPMSQDEHDFLTGEGIYA